MAQAAVTYESVMHDLKARDFKPIYYLMGDESYYIDKISDWIAENVLQPEEKKAAMTCSQNLMQKSQSLSLLW